MSGQMAGGARRRRPGGADRGVRAFERRIGRQLIGATYIAVALLVIGVVLMALAGISPLRRRARPSSPERSSATSSRSSPTGFLWLGLVFVIATPISRVIVAAIGVSRGRVTA